MPVHQVTLEKKRANTPQTRKRRRSRSNSKLPAPFSLLSSQGRVLFYIAVCPDSPVREIADNLGLTERAVWGIVRDLRQRNMIHLRKKGRRHHYAVNLDAPLLHPTIHGVTLRPILGKVAAQTKRERPDACD